MRTALAAGLLLSPATLLAQTECANVLLVVDRSESMKRVDSRETRRWDEVASAVEQIVTDYSDGVRFGLALFPGDSETEQCPGNCEPGDVVVEVGSGTGEAILAAMEASTRCQTTPIGATMEALESYAPLRDDDRFDYIVLVTDGADNCPLGDEVNAAADLLGWGVETYVVGFDFGEIDTTSVNAIAAAGGTGTAVIARDPESLRTAFDDILGDLYRDPEFGCVGGGDSDSDSDSDTDSSSDADAGAGSAKGDGGCGCGVAGEPGATSAGGIALATLAILRRRR